MINIVLFGKPGAGKGTQAQFLKEKYNLTHISTGDVFRYNLTNNTELGQLAKSYLANSTSLILRRLGAKVFFSGPEFWFDEGMLVNGTFHPLDSLIRSVDVLIMLRIQNERHINKVQMPNDEYLKKFGLTKEREREMKEHAIIMHPAPINRGVEIDADLVECKRSRIFKQMENGVFARMAILKHTLVSKGYKFND